MWAWVTSRLWPSLAELGMAFAGLVVGWGVVGVIASAIGAGPWTLAAGPTITAIAALFYARVGPAWARAASELAADGSEPRVPAAAQFPRQALPRTAVVVAGGVVVALLGSIAIGLLFDALDLEVREQGTVVSITQGAREHGLTLDAVLLAVSALVLAPLAEEWLFRGLLFPRIAGRAGRVMAYVVSALGFAAIHGNPTGFVVYLWLGLVFAFVLTRTGRLGAAMAVHMGNNAYVLLVLFGAG